MYRIYAKREIRKKKIEQQYDIRMIFTTTEKKTDNNNLK